MLMWGQPALGCPLERSSNAFGRQQNWRLLFLRHQKVSLA